MFLLSLRLSSFLQVLNFLRIYPSLFQYIYSHQGFTSGSSILGGLWAAQPQGHSGPPRLSSSLPSHGFLSPLPGILPPGICVFLFVGLLLVWAELKCVWYFLETSTRPKPISPCLTPVSLTGYRMWVALNFFQNF